MPENSPGARIVAVGLLTAGDLDRLGTGFQRVFPITEGEPFADLLRRIDEVTTQPGGDTRRPTDLR